MFSGLGESIAQSSWGRSINGPKDKSSSGDQVPGISQPFSKKNKNVVHSGGEGFTLANAFPILRSFLFDLTSFIAKNIHGIIVY